MLCDDLPFWIELNGRPHLIVPYALDCNDFKFLLPNGWTTGRDFYDYLVDTFDELYAEGAVAPRLMNVGLHCRIVGRPGRANGLRRFLDHLADYPDVWVTTRAEIARHWHAVAPPPAPPPP
jgi:peptidoglycan/xylan/chitin deacetylase (PgdA/CDA1 family)